MKLKENQTQVLLALKRVLILGLLLVCSSTILSAQISTSKRVLGWGVTPSGDYLIKYEIRVENHGTDPACDIEVIDDLGSLYTVGGVNCISEIILNSIYGGGFNSNNWNSDVDGSGSGNYGADGLFDPMGACLDPAPGNRLTINFSVKVDADCALDNETYNNSADINSSEGNDTTDDGTNTSPGNAAGDDPSPVTLCDTESIIGIAQEVPNEDPTVNLDGTTDWTMIMTICNYDNDTNTGLPSNNVTANQSLGTFYNNGIPLNSVEVCNPTGPLIINPDYNGGATSVGGVATTPEWDFVTGGDLAVNECDTMEIKINSGATTQQNVYRYVRAEACTDSGNPNCPRYCDDGDASLNPDDDGTCGPASDCSYSRVRFEYMAGIDLTKTQTAEAVAASGTIGNVDLTYEYVVTADGTNDVYLYELELIDDLATQWGAGCFVGVTTQPVISNSTATSTPTASTSFTGTGTTGLSGGDLLDASAAVPDTLAPGESFTVTVVVEVDLDQCADPIVNTATVTGTDPAGEDVSATDDESIDQADLILPAVQLAKDIVSTVPAASGTDGNWDITYEFEIENIGTDQLCNVSLVDDVMAQYGGALVGVTTQPMITGGTATTPGGTVTTYTASSAQPEMLDLTACIDPGQTLIVQVVLEIDPDNPTAIFDPVTGALMNQATTTGDGTLSGGTVEDDSDDNGDATDGDPDTPTPLVLPGIDLAKSIVDFVPATSGTANHYDVTYEFVLTNTGNEDMCSISLQDDIAAQYGGAYIGVVTQPVITGGSAYQLGAVTGTAYGPSGQNEMLALDGCFAPGEDIIVQVVIEVYPNSPTAILSPNGTLDNQATTTAVGEDSGLSAEDLSDDEGDATDGDDDTPTPLVIPAIGLAKDITNVADAASGIEGNFDVTYEFVIQNVGTDTLCNILLQDNLDAQIGTAFQGVVTAPTITGGTSYLPGTTTGGAYTGTALGDEMLSGDGCIAPTETIIVEVVVEIDPDDPGAIYNPVTGTLDNQGTTSGDGQQSGETVEDDSDDGSDPDGDNGEGGEDDPTPFSVPSIGLAKDIVGTAPATSGVSGNYDVTYEFVIHSNWRNNYSPSCCRSRS